MREEKVQFRSTELDEDLIALLDENGLATRDLDEGELVVFEVRHNSKRIGAGALEPTGPYALLRSVVVEEEYRENGIGTSLVNNLLTEARNRNFNALYLLTEGAAGFFKQFGFHEIPRESVPEAVLSTDQFKNLCPDSATCMRLELASES